MDKNQSIEAPNTVLTPDEARASVKLGVMRYVLAISLSGVILAMVVAWLVFAPR